MSDANVAVTFSASTSDMLSGIDGLREALSGLSAPLGELNTGLSDSADELNLTLSRMHATAHRQQELLRQTLKGYADDTREHRMSEEEKVSNSQKAIDKEFEARKALLKEEAGLVGLSAIQKQKITNQMGDVETQHLIQIDNLTHESLNSRQREYENYGNAITQAFNGQLRGLLQGTESWHKAFKAVLEDLLIKFVEWGETQVVQSIAVEAAKTSATSAGVGARTSLEQAGATASLATQGAKMIRSIVGSAAEAFAGVFGFLAPILGPFAAGPAAAAQATVAAAAGAGASADIGLWSVPQDMLTMVHHNELIMPAAEAGAFRNMLSGDGAQASGGGQMHIHPTTHVHVSAIDGGSVSQWMRSNSSTMMKAIDEAVRHGAHLGARRLSQR